MNLDTVKALFKKRANEIATGAHDKTGVFDAYLSDKRIPVAPPEDIIDENGKAVFGTFDREFQKMSFTKIHKQSCLPDFTNPIRYTRWEATEVNFDDVLFLTAVCNMGIIGVALTLVYDKETEELLAWKEMMLPQWAVISETLLNKDETYSKGFMNKILYKNDFGNGKAYVSGNAKSKAGKVNCILVKDFSRFGRNYVELGDYLEQYFPFLGVRFISVNDNYDSKDFDGTTGGLDVAFKNMIYDFYSREFSKKQRIAWRRMAEKGE